MCGIHASLSTESFRFPSHNLKKLLHNRGPDHGGEEEVKIENQRGPYYLSFTSTVLSLRGGHVTIQPFVDFKTGSILCWNGEAWKIGADVITGNDGQAVFNALLEVIPGHSTLESTTAVLNLLNSISGPFAFVFLDRIHKQIFFGRDRLGRRSLLCCTTSNSIEFSSAADPLDGVWKEVEADAVYSLPLDLSATAGAQNSAATHMLSILPFQRYAWAANENFLETSLGQLNRSIPCGNEPLTSRSNAVRELKNYLCESLKLRTLNIPKPPISGNEPDVRVAVLFSGGLDCTVLARMMHSILPLVYQIDLLNVAFENPRVIQAAKHPQRSKKIKRTYHEGTGGDGDHVSLSHQGDGDDSPYETCPDRETGRRAFQELNKVCPSRTWRFIAVDVPYTETTSHRSEIINLIHPHNTEMDLSIAYALYFASRGKGVASTNIDSDPIQYTTPARVLLSGLGADELFGGYTRHATAFNRNGFIGLLDELELDVSRLGKRNLGRDDRAISHWAREARFPYLDESLVKWALKCPIWQKCGFGLEASPTSEDDLNIEPGKKILRLLAAELGMQSVAHEKKRAIQFGARTAKMEVGRTKGTSLIA